MMEIDADTIEVRGYIRRKHKGPKTLNEASHMILEEMNKPPDAASTPNKTTSRKDKQ